MNCYLESENLDPLFWVEKNKFYDNFDLLDFNENREVRDVKDFYLNDWFGFDKRDKAVFYVAPVRLKVNGKTEFLGGRHRTAVLLNHLDVIPLGFVRGSIPPTYGDAEKWAESLGFKKILENEILKLPDLQIRQ